MLSRNLNQQILSANILAFLGNNSETCTQKENKEEEEEKERKKKKSGVLGTSICNLLLSCRLEPADIPVSGPMWGTSFSLFNLLHFNSSFQSAYHMFGSHLQNFS